MGTAVQMNVRIDSALKRHGDEVFQRNGISPSQAVRRVWEYAAEHNDVPAFMQTTAADEHGEEMRERLALARKGSGLAVRTALPHPAAHPEARPPQGFAEACRTMEDLYDEMLDSMHRMFAEARENHAE